jgi:aspartyl-tRNA synthetase
MGWVARLRDLGGLKFIDLRDRYGTTQLVVHPEEEALTELSRRLRMEDVIAVEGLVNARPGDQAREDKSTGGIEVSVSDMVVLNKSKVLPFQIADEVKANEETRLKYRYIDLRRNPLRENLELRHRVILAVRKYLDGRGFLEI